MRGIFVSDLHILARRSQADDYLHEIVRVASRADAFVLGGDIFDFKWSRLGSFEQSVEAAINWLQGLLESLPACRFHYLLGNHDDHPHFVQRLQEFAAARRFLEIHPELLSIGPCVFLHGHILDGYLPQELSAVPGRAPILMPNLENCTTAPFQRSHWISHLAYDALVRTRVHRLVVNAIHRPVRTADRLTEYLAEKGISSETGARDVYFGHTHRQMIGFSHRGLRFHNGGAAIVGLPFQVLEWGIDPSPHQPSVSQTTSEASDGG